MPKLFEIHLPEGMSTVKLDSQGRATVQYSVKNVSAREIDGRAVLVSIPVTQPPGGPVERGWVKVDGKTDRHFGINKEETFSVNIAVPPKSAPGDYTFRLDTVWVDQTDQGDIGGAIRFSVPKVETNGHGMLWLIPVILVVVIGMAVALWFLLKSPTVPNLVGLDTAAAGTAIQKVGMTLDEKKVSTSKPEEIGKILSQDTAKGQKATKGGKVGVTVGAETLVSVKSVVGQTLGQAIVTLNGQGLEVTPSFSGDTTLTVASQNPAPPATVKPGSSVTLAFPTNSCGPNRICLITGFAAVQRIQAERVQALSRGLKPQ